MRIDTKIVFLTGLQGKTSPKIDCCVANLVLPSRKNPQGCQAGIRLIPTQEVSEMTNQSYKFIMTPKHALAGYGHLASGLIASGLETLTACGAVLPVTILTMPSARHLVVWVVDRLVPFSCLLSSIDATFNAAVNVKTQSISLLCYGWWLERCSQRR